MIDAMIITYNESLNLPHCLEALKGWTNKVFVIDSGSTDGTQDIARRHGAIVHDHAWEGYARQKNWALANLPFESPWILIVDADETITPDLRQRLLAIAGQPPESVPENGYFINRLTYFMDRPIRHCGYFPSWNLRLLKRGKGRYEDREVHEHIIINDPVGYVREVMLHHDRRGLEHYMAKHNRYSTLEARALFLETTRHGMDDPTANLTALARRRRWLKRNVMPNIPVPGLVRFLYMYVLQLGFLDGRAGLEFCRFISMYDALVAMKLRDLRRQARSRAISPDEGRKSTVALAVAEGTLPIAPPRSTAKSAVTTMPREPAPEATARPVERPETAGPAIAMPRHAQADSFIEAVEADRLPEGDWPAVRSVPVSVLIPVKNEKANIIACIRHVLWANEIVVVDSQSTDTTVPLSQAMGADVYQFSYPASGWPKKKNWALENVPWKNEWVLILDADEHMTPELTQEVVDVVNGRYQPRDARHAGCGDGYWLNRRFMFMGRWIKGCGYYPSYNVRLLKHAVGRYERIGDLGDTQSGDNEVHEHIVLSTGKAGYLEHDFLHYAYPDLTTWIEKHNRYSNWEAHAMAAGNKGSLQATPFGGAIERRRWVKQLARHLPLRPTLRFIYSYILKRGFLDGYPGLVMSRLMAWYEFVSIAKFQEMRIRDRSQKR